MNTWTTMYTGGCLCGDVRYELSGEPGPIDICHCRMCRKAQGGPFATNAPVAASAFRITAGRTRLVAYESSPGEQRLFCGRCGSPVYSKRADRPSVVRIRVGTVDQPLRTRPAAHYYTGSRCNWWAIDDDLPSFDGE